jgi:hypothetical protein
MSDSSPIIRLYDRMSRKSEQGKPLQMSAEEVDWFVLCGGYKAVMLAAESHAFERARARVEARGEYLKDLAELVEARKLPEGGGSDNPAG